MLRAYQDGSELSAEHHHLGAHRRAGIKVDDVLVDHADAAGGDAPANREGLHRAVDAVERVLVSLPEIERAGAERVARAAMHANAALEFAHLTRELWLALQHFL